MYRLIRNLLFLFPTERVHYFSMNMLRLACRIGWVRRRIWKTCTMQHHGFQQHSFGLTFQNPVGLAAGFDKNARYLTELETLGFGYVEIGTVTPLPQDGNPRPRLFRLPKDGALINRMGFNNEGAERIAARLKAWRNSGKHLSPGFLVGGNIGKNKQTPNEEAWLDYDRCFRALFAWVDYFVVNVSSPNTPGLRALQEKEALRKILTHLQSLNRELANRAALQPRPILLKIAPDLELSAIDEVLELALEIHLDGIVATNTTIAREGLNTPATELARIGAGGLSGKPLRKRSTAIVGYLHEKSSGKMPVIASGGIFDAASAHEKREAGARLIQVWTGFIYEGPGIVKKILRGLKPLN